jgi:hypothetical protein
LPSAAVQEKDLRLLRACVTATHIVPSINAKLRPDGDEDTLTLAMTQGDLEAIKCIVNHRNDQGRVAMPTTSNAEESNTGQASKYSQLRRSGEVGVARSGKEGNAAFLADNDKCPPYEPHPFASMCPSLLAAFRDRTLREPVIDCLLHVDPTISYTARTFGIFLACEAGNRTAALATLQVLKEGGFGVTDSHFMACDPSHPHSTVQQQQVLKKVQVANSINPLQMAAVFAEAGRFKAMLQMAGMSTSERDDLGRSMLHYAAVNPDGAENLQQLLALQMNPAHRDKGLVTPLHLACRFGNADCVQVLLEAAMAQAQGRAEALASGGGDPAGDGDGDGDAPKKKSKAMATKEEIERFGLGKDRRGHTPLHYAALTGNLPVRYGLPGSACARAKNGGWGGGEGGKECMTCRLHLI